MLFQPAASRTPGAVVTDVCSCRSEGVVVTAGYLRRPILSGELILDVAIQIAQARLHVGDGLALIDIEGALGLAEQR